MPEANKGQKMQKCLVAGVVAMVMAMVLATLSSSWGYKASGTHIELDLLTGELTKTWFWMGIPVKQEVQKSGLERLFSQADVKGNAYQPERVVVRTEGLLRPVRIASQHGKALHVADKIMELVERYNLRADEREIANALVTGNHHRLDDIRYDLIEDAIRKTGSSEE